MSVCLSFDEDNHNCFSFCLQFINSVLSVEGRHPLSRDAFTHTFILPRMNRASRYVTLYRHIQRQRYYLLDKQGERQEDREKEGQTDRNSEEDRQTGGLRTDRQDNV